MIEDFIGGCFETFGHWILGLVFFVAGLVVAVQTLGADDPVFRGALALLLFHASAMLIVGFGFKRATKLLTATWLVYLVLFLGWVAFLAAR